MVKFFFNHMEKFLPVDRLHSDLFKIVHSLIFDFQLHIHGYRLITNGGRKQAIPQWHWHLISDDYGGNHA